MSIKYFTTLFVVSFISFTMGLVWITSPRESWVGDGSNINLIKQEAKNNKSEHEVKYMSPHLKKDSLELQKKDSISEANRTNP